jgi:hypothetical protein
LAWTRATSNNGAAPSTGQPLPLAAQTTASGPTSYINEDQVTELGDMLRENGLDKDAFLRAIKVASLQVIPAEKYAKAKSIIVDTIEKRRQTA